jgi:bacterioferritin-associated ferredoxin
MPTIWAVHDVAPFDRLSDSGGTASRIKSERPTHPVGIIIAFPWLRTPDAALAMIICSCNVLSDHEVRAIIVRTDANPQTAVQVHIHLGCRLQCGRCAATIRRILVDALRYEETRLHENGDLPTPYASLSSPTRRRMGG